MRQPVMQGRGYYNAHSTLQARSAVEADLLLARALDTVALPEGQLIIADFGSSQGRNSARPIGMILDRLAERAGGRREMMVIHTDLPQSDFTSLFEMLEAGPDSYLRQRPYAFASAIGRSFYERLLPAGSLTLGWSAFALHWMSTLPAVLPDHIWLARATSGEARLLAGVAAEDWRRFLAHRSRELVPGGQLVLIVGAGDDAGMTGLEPLMDLANGVLQALVSESLLEAGSYAAMTIPCRPRSREEFIAPFEAGEVPELMLEELVIGQTPNPALLRWEETGDADTLAVDITGFFIAAFGPSLFGENDELRDLFARRLAAALARQPGLVMPLVTATLRIARR